MKVRVKYHGSLVEFHGQEGTAEVDPGSRSGQLRLVLESGQVLRSINQRSVTATGVVLHGSDR